MSEVVSSRSAMDSRLLSLARRSPVEIAEFTGLDAGFVAERISVLLESSDWLSERQQERLLLLEVSDLKDLVLERVRGAADEDFAQVANVALRSLKLIGDRLDSRRRLVDADLQSITQAQARMFGGAFDVALNHVVESFKSVSGSVVSEDVDVFVREGLRLASVELERSVSFE